MAMNLINYQTLSHFQDYKAANKALYIWSHSSRKEIDNLPSWRQLIRNHNGSFDRLLQFCEINNFSSLSLFIGSCEWEWEDSFRFHRFPEEYYLQQRLSQLNKLNITTDLVVYLNDEPDNLSHTEYLLNVAWAAKKLSQNGLVFGLHIDQEPQNKNNLEQLALILNHMNQIFPVGTVLKPAWLHLKISEIPLSHQFQSSIDIRVQTYAELLMSLSHSTLLMDYSNNTKVILDRANQFQQSLAKLGKFGSTIIETGISGAAPDETLGQLIKTNTNAFFSFLQQFASANNIVVIHDYRQYFKLLYGVMPDEHDGKL